MYAAVPMAARPLRAARTHAWGPLPGSLQPRLERHPVLALAAALLLLGPGMVLALLAVTAALTLPLALLLGWF